MTASGAKSHSRAERFGWVTPIAERLTVLPLDGRCDDCAALSTNGGTCPGGSPGPVADDRLPMCHSAAAEHYRARSSIRD